jgi:Ulp1 family protease
VINFYLQLVLRRAQRDGAGPAGSVDVDAPLRCHVFQTFFYRQLTDEGYD